VKVLGCSLVTLFCSIPPKAVCISIFLESVPSCVPALCLLVAAADAAEFAFCAPLSLSIITEQNAKASKVHLGCEEKARRLLCALASGEKD